MNKKKIIFLCRQIFSDANRAQYNRTRFLSDKYSLFIIAIGPVSSMASREAKEVNIFPFDKKISEVFFIFWCLWTFFRIKIVNKEVCSFYTTYEPRNIILGFIVKLFFRMNWTVDLWDDPEKALLIYKEQSRNRNKFFIYAKEIEFRIMKYCIKHADNIIIGLVPDGVIKKYSLKHNRILSVTNGINLDYNIVKQSSAINNASDRFTIFYCGTVDKIRLEGLFQCMQAALKIIPEIKIVIIGIEVPGASQWLEQGLKKFESRVLLDIRGRQPYSHVIRGIIDSDVCICPYPDKIDIAATYPIKIFDYMFMGKPVVASRLPGIERIINHKVDGFLFEPGQYGEMAVCIIKLYNSVTLRRKISENAKKNVVRFGWDSIHNEIYAFMEPVCQ